MDRDRSRSTDGDAGEGPSWSPSARRTTGRLSAARTISIIWPRGSPGSTALAMLRQQLSLVKSRQLRGVQAGAGDAAVPDHERDLCRQRGQHLVTCTTASCRDAIRSSTGASRSTAPIRAPSGTGFTRSTSCRSCSIPPSGYVQNCNSSPFTTCDDGNPPREQFPPYMVEDQHDDKRRAKISRQLLRRNARRDVRGFAASGLRHDGLLGTRTSARVSPPVRGAQDETIRPLAAKVEPYLEHLLAWDCRVTADSTAATLCEAWYEELYGMDYPAETLLPQLCREPEARIPRRWSPRPRTSRSGTATGALPGANLFRAQRRPQMIDLLGLTFDDRLPSLPTLAAPGPMGVVFTRVLLAVDPHSVRHSICSNGTAWSAPATWRSTNSGRRSREPACSTSARAAIRIRRITSTRRSCFPSGSSSRNCSIGTTCWPAPSLVYHPGEPPLENVAK